MFQGVSTKKLKLLMDRCEQMSSSTQEKTDESTSTIDSNNVCLRVPPNTSLSSPTISGDLGEIESNSDSSDESSKFSLTQSYEFQQFPWKTTMK